MLELYYFPTATCGYKARLALAEKQVEFTHRVLDRDAGDLLTPHYLKLNPNAVVPTMVHDGAVLIESSIIMVYTDEAFDGPSLRPAAALGRARAAAWLKRADDHLPALGAVTYGTFRRKEILTKPDEELASYYAAIPDPERRAQRRAVIEQGVEAPLVSAGYRALDRLFASMNDQLYSQTYLTGTGYGLADAALTPFVSRLDELGMAWMWDKRPHLAGWWDNVRRRPSFETVFAAYPDPARKAGLRAAGEEAAGRVKAIILAGD